MAEVLLPSHQGKMWTAYVLFVSGIHVKYNCKFKSLKVRKDMLVSSPFASSSVLQSTGSLIR